MRLNSSFVILSAVVLVVCSASGASAQLRNWFGAGSHSKGEAGKHEKVIHVHQYLIPEKKSFLACQPCPHRARILESAAIERVPSPIRRTDFRYRLEAAEVTGLEAAPLQPTCEEELLQYKLKTKEQDEKMTAMEAEIAKLKELIEAQRRVLSDKGVIPNGD